MPRRRWRPGGDGDRRLMDLEGQVADLRRILASLGEGVLAVDQAGIVVYVNRVAQRLLDVDRARCVGHHMFAVVPHEAACHALEDVMRRDAPRARRDEVIVERGSGDLVLSIAVSPLRLSADDDDGDDGEPDVVAEGAIAVIRDITELKRLERTRNEFFGNVSHELKTPITAIRGSLETIADDEEMERRHIDRFVSGALSHSRRLSMLVTDLLTLSRLESGPTELDHVNVDVVELVRGVVTDTDPLAEHNGIVVSVETAVADRTVVRGDEEALRQALLNLVSNAIAHSERGRDVRVVVRGGAAEGVVVVEVVDSGVGIPADALDRVFERFYRVDAARSRERGGTGIGLSIVKHVAGAHGGTVEARSELGVGSTFTLTLPVGDGAG